MRSVSHTHNTAKVTCPGLYTQFFWHCFYRHASRSPPELYCMSMPEVFRRGVAFACCNWWLQITRGGALRTLIPKGYLEYGEVSRLRQLILV